MLFNSYTSNKHLKIIVTLCLFFTGLNTFAVDKVTTSKDENGWKIQVNGNDLYIKGVVWGYTPKNENHSYNLWDEEDAFVQKVLDYDFGLMQKAGINAIRSFATIPPKWVTYIYEKYVIMTAINPLMGRYGISINGVWNPNTNYSDPTTRKILKEEVLNTVKTYKDVPGVLMFALGNESNYGLSWKSFEIENLPIGEQNLAKAEHLYSLFAEIINEGKELDSNHLFTIVNGDIQYIDLIIKYGKNFDLLGVNAYRGVSFTELWKDVKEKLDKPILMFEFGSDAFNAKDFVEDEASQASYLKDQWLEMYRKSYHQGAEGNSLGGFVFEWRDEWWKYKQTENLNKHDRNASWSNGGYQSDYVKGQNNMNEEWWGITRLGDINSDGFYNAEPRAAYYVLSDMWKINPYQSNEEFINDIRDKVETTIRQAKQSYSEKLESRSSPFKITGGRIKLDVLNKSLSNQSSSDDQGLMGFVSIDFKPTRNLETNFTVNLIADATDSDFNFKYGDRINDESSTNGGNKLELYDFNGTYKHKNFDLLGFYHVPRYHWGDKGDFFGLLRETTDMEGQDIWNSKAPYGVEFVGKGSLDGLNILTGPEIYWGANPKTIIKYQFGKNKAYTIMYAQDFSRNQDTSGGNEATKRESRQTTLQGKFDLGNNTKLRVGGIISNTDRVDDIFDRYEGGKIIRDTIEFKDTLGFKAKLDFDLRDNIRAYAGFNYAGLVAEGGEPIKAKGSQLPSSGLGNKKELEFGANISHSNYTISPRMLYRTNIVDANQSIAATATGGILSPGIVVRNQDDDPFAVLDNRAARSVELYLTYDPTPSTYFYKWDNDVRENAKFAYNVGVTFTKYKGTTDSHLFYYKEGGFNAPFGTGLAAEDVWLAKSKMIFNPNKKFKTVIKLESGEQQSTGEPEKKLTKYYSIDGKFIVKRQNIISIKYKKDAFGPYDFERQFNLTYPEQYELGYTRLLDKGKSEKDSSKFGIKLLHRTLDENSDNKFYQDGVNSSMFEIQSFIEYVF